MVYSNALNNPLYILVHMKYCFHQNSNESTVESENNKSVFDASTPSCGILWSARVSIFNNKIT